MRTIHATLLLTIAIFLLSNTTFASQINIKEGQWEITTTMEIAGMPHKMPGMTFTECLTNNDIIPQGTPEDGCTITDQHIDGNTAYYAMACDRDGETTTSNGSFTYDNDKMSGKMDITHAEMHMSTTYSGKWIGPCN